MPSLNDRDMAFLRNLQRGQTVTGLVTEIATFGVTFVDIGGFTAIDRSATSSPIPSPNSSPSPRRRRQLSG
ncbi:hypothetical protein ACFXJ8_34700 [Nonomuraea sp. NPDC059194]|uniref:hypothetical protein n=1 Tax=Nonomuraea sp. NPDC059194 TaxID=3346764 RepID=UPI003673B234